NGERVNEAMRQGVPPDKHRVQIILVDRARREILAVLLRVLPGTQPVLVQSEWKVSAIHKRSRGEVHKQALTICFHTRIPCASVGIDIGSLHNSALEWIEASISPLDHHHAQS